MSRRVKKLTPSALKRMIMDEAKKLHLEVLETGEEDSEKVAKNAPEVDADEYADSIEQDIDWMKSLKIHEMRLAKKIVTQRSKLRKIKEAKTKIKSRLSKKI